LNNSKLLLVDILNTAKSSPNIDKFVLNNSKLLLVDILNTEKSFDKTDKFVFNSVMVDVVDNSKTLESSYKPLSVLSCNPVRVISINIIIKILLLNILISEYLFKCSKK
jgi:hypothetical protein